MRFLKFISAGIILFFLHISVWSQTDYTSETKFNQNSSRKVSGDENLHSSFREPSKIPQKLINEYNTARDKNDEAEKQRLSNKIEKYLSKQNMTYQDASSIFIQENESPPPFNPDWYQSDVQVATTEIGYTGSYRHIDLKQGEDGWLYLAVNRRNIPNYNAGLWVYRSSNGGANWVFVQGVISTNYWSSLSMLVERRDNNNNDSTRIVIYITSSQNSNFNDAFLGCVSFRRDGSGYYSSVVDNPAAGNRFEYATACSDGMFSSSTTYFHAVVREETNAGAQVRFHHFRSINWGFNHTSASYNLFYDDVNPSVAFSNETGNDSIYIAFERRIANDEWEIRLLATDEIPNTNYQIRFITDATSGTLYERPDITIQQRHFSLPQQILVTSTKNDRAVYHASTDGGASWNIDAALGLVSQPVDYTSCNSDSLTSGLGYFIAAYVDLDGDSVTVRRGILGAMGTVQHRRNSNQSTGLLAPVCAIYKEGSNKYSAFAYAGLGPANVFFNMENLVTGITPISGTIPSVYSLSQNYPNPFNPVTNINFSLPKAGLVTLKVYDIAGREAAELVNQNLNAGTYNYDFDASHLSSGVYFYRITAEGFTDVKKMVIVK